MRATPSSAVRQAQLVDLHVGQQIRHRRTVAKLSQTMVGEHLGVSFQQVQKYERGTNRVGAGRLYQLGELLNVSVSVFFDGLNGKLKGTVDHDESEMDALMEFATSREGLALYRAYLAAPSPATRKLALDVLRLGSEQGR